MKIITFLIAALFFLGACSSKNVKKESLAHTKQKVPFSVLLYDGPELSADKVVRIVTEQNSHRYMYFIAVDDKKIRSGSLMNGPREILLKPGSYALRVRFVAKGKLAIPLKPLPKAKFEAGKTYILKSSLEMGKGNYISAAKNTKIVVWAEEVGSAKKVTQLTANGFGK